MMSPEKIRYEFETVSHIINRIDQHPRSYDIDHDIIDSLVSYWRALAVVMEIPASILCNWKPYHTGHTPVDWWVKGLDKMDAEEAAGHDR